MNKQQVDALNKENKKQQIIFNKVSKKMKKQFMKVAMGLFVFGVLVNFEINVALGCRLILLKRTL